MSVGYVQAEEAKVIFSTPFSTAVSKTMLSSAMFVAQFAG